MSIQNWARVFTMPQLAPAPWQCRFGMKPDNCTTWANSCFSLAGVMEPTCLRIFGAQGRTENGQLVTAFHTTAEPATCTSPYAGLGRRWNIVRNGSK